MSFLNDIVDFAGGVWDWATGSSTSAGIARAAALGYMLKEVQASINRDNQRDTPTSASPDEPVKIDYGVREEIDPDTEHRIPVVYGEAFISGVVTDAVLSDDQTTMWYCLTICEKTGRHLSTNRDSTISFEKVYWNESTVNFRSDGVTVQSLSDDDGNVNDKVNGLIEFYFYNDGSEKPVPLSGLAVGAPQYAYNLFPNWTEQHKMSKLVFALIKVRYSSENGVTGIGNLQFKLKNTLTEPGDVLYDYMTNTIYGAGITPEDIYK
jgi:hypothetical protein